MNAQAPPGSRGYKEQAVLTASPTTSWSCSTTALCASSSRPRRPCGRGTRVAGRAHLKAEAIVDELLSTLDMSAGEAAERPRRCTFFSKHHLLEARREGSAEKIDEVADAARAPRRLGPDRALSARGATSRTLRAALALAERERVLVHEGRADELEELPAARAALVAEPPACPPREAAELLRVPRGAGGDERTARGRPALRARRAGAPGTRPRSRAAATRRPGTGGGAPSCCVAGVPSPAARRVSLSRGSLSRLDRRTREEGPRSAPSRVAPPRSIIT